MLVLSRSQTRNGDGCNTRDQVLFITLDKHRPYGVRRQGRCPTDVVAGTWTDLYSHREMTWTDLKDPAQAERLPLDHILSLAGAWRYGARDWTSDERLRFANDPEPGAHYFRGQQRQE